MKELRTELIKYALWYDRCTMPEDCQTPECDLIQNVDSYIAIHPDIAETETTELKKVIPTRPESEGKLYEEGVRLGLIAINGRSDFHLGWRFCYDWIAEAMPETTDKDYDIDFSGHYKCRLHVHENKITIEAAVTGWGNAVSIEDIEVTEL